MFSAFLFKFPRQSPSECTDTFLSSMTKCVTVSPHLTVSSQLSAIASRLISSISHFLGSSFINSSFLSASISLLL